MTTVELDPARPRRGPEPSTEVARLFEAAARGKGVLFPATTRQQQIALRNRLYQAARRHDARVTTELRREGLAAWLTVSVRVERGGGPPRA